MQNFKKIEWALRIAAFGTFFGHSMFALQGKAEWVQWIMDFGGWDMSTATQLLFLIGLLDLTVSLIVLFKPMRVVLLWAVLWTTWTAFMRVLPFIGDPIWDFIEQWPNIGVPLALFFLRGCPKEWREWFR